MKLTSAFSILVPIVLGNVVALIPTLFYTIIRPKLLFRPGEISKIFMSYVWAAFSDSIDKNDAEVKRALLEPEADGVVLDIGAGHGHAAQYLNLDQVSCYIALEPNTYMHQQIRANAHKVGLFESDGRLIILGCGAEDTPAIVEALRNHNGTIRHVDTIISIFTLCCVPNPNKTIGALVRDTLRPGGKFLYYEHVRSHRDDIVWWQSFWTPIWRGLFGGCNIDRETNRVILNLETDRDGKAMGEGKVWREWKQWDNKDDDPEELFSRTLGRFIKE